MKNVILQMTYFLNGPPWLICCFIVMLVYIDIKHFLREI